MHNTVKTLVISAGLACALVLGACGTQSETTTTVSTDEGTTTTTTTTTTDESGTTTTTETTETTNTEGAGTYTNEYFNVNFEAPGGWQVLDSSANPSIDSNFAALANGGQVIMVAKPSDGGASGVIFVREDPTDATANMTAEDHVKANTAADAKTMQDGGITAEFNEATITLGSNTLYADEYIVSGADGTKTYMLQSCTKGADGDFLTMIIMGASEEEILQTVTYIKTVE